MTRQTHAPHRRRTTLLVALGLSIGIGMAAPAIAQPAANAALVFERAAQNVWVLRASDAQGRVLSTGSAIAIAPGTAITSCQLLAKASQLSLQRDNVSYGATLALPDPERDLCQLRVPSLPAPSLAMLGASELQVGMPLFTVGAPRGKELALGVTMLSAVRRGDDGALDALQLAAAPEAGLGGAGVFDQQGRLAGLLGGAAPTRLAMPAPWIAELPRRGRAAIEAGDAAPIGTAAPAPGTPSFQTLEYTLRDRLTRNTRKVVYRLDGERDGRRSFNNGGWVEKTSGEVIEVSAPVAGDFDSVMPPGGWARGELAEGSNWSDTYQTGSGTTLVKMRVSATVESAETVQVAGHELQAIRIEYRGYTTRGANSVGSTQNQTGKYTATAWYAPDLRRIVRFAARTRGGIGGGAFVVDEELELVAIR